MSVCRHCGRNAVLNDTPYGVCDACANSPLCDRCGHERDDHAPVVPDAKPGCRGTLGDFQTLDVTPCPCEGFEPIQGMLADATFVQADDPEPPAGPPLRLV